MKWLLHSLFYTDLATDAERDQLADTARQRRWGLALLLVGWLHLATFGACYYLTIARDYHGAAGYLALWLSELCGMWLIFRLCGGRRQSAAMPLELFVRRVWIAYFFLVFNLGSLNTLRGHQMFEFFPASASLASFAFIMLTLVVNLQFFGAVVVMFAAGLLMAAHLHHAFLIFAIAWWLVLTGIGAKLGRHPRGGNGTSEPTPRDGACTVASINLTHPATSGFSACSQPSK
jgi:hypothetical protein